MVRLSDPSIEITGPGSLAFGLEILWDRLLRSRVRFDPRRTFVRGHTVVVDQRAIWYSPGTGERMGEANAPSVFIVRDGRICYFARFDSLAAALHHAGLSAADEV